MRPLLCLSLLLCCLPACFAADRPNFLIIMADDCTYNDLSIYGGLNARTPNLDRLADQGVVFDRAFLASAMCQPCRAELYTGQYPMRNGCAWNHSACRTGTRSLPHFLPPLGYRVGLAGKVHVLPEASFPFESVPGFDPSCTRDPTRPHDLQGVRDFIGRNPAQPFCLVVALVEPHVPWVMGDASQYPPKKIKLPPNLADTPKTREDFGRYLAEITYMDGQVGEILAALNASGLDDRTLVLFTSEQGSQFPGNKWTAWDTGLRTGLVARWQTRIPGRLRTSAMVQYADVAPTLLELAGGNPHDASFQFDGASFASVLLQRTNLHRQFSYGAHNNIPEGPAYPIRTVSDGRYRYIRNLAPQEIYIEKHLMGLLGGGAPHNAYWPSWVATSWANPTNYGLVKRYMVRPAEELYDSNSDPYQLTNLVAAPQLSARKKELSAELDRWLAAQGDPGVPEDTHEAHQAANRGQHLYYPPGSPGKN